MKLHASQRCELEFMIIPSGLQPLICKWRCFVHTTYKAGPSHLQVTVPSQAYTSQSVIITGKKLSLLSFFYLIMKCVHYIGISCKPNLNSISTGTKCILFSYILYLCKFSGSGSNKYLMLFSFTQEFQTYFEGVQLIIEWERWFGIKVLFLSMSKDNTYWICFKYFFFIATVEDNFLLTMQLFHF